PLEQADRRRARGHGEHRRGAPLARVRQARRALARTARGEAALSGDDPAMDVSDSLEVALDGMILRRTVRSTAHGRHLEARDDGDEMGVAIEPPRLAVGLEQWEHHVERTQPEGVRSGPGDLDLVVYSARKFCRLALQGNPTVLLLLFTPDPLVEHELGAELRALAPA